MKINESQLRQIIKESIKEVLKESVWSRKTTHETPYITVKETVPYRGRDPKGINYNVYVDGVKMFRANLTGSEADSWNGKSMQRGTYSDITIYFGAGYGTKPALKNSGVFAKQIGFNDDFDFNSKQAKDNVQQIVEWCNFHINRSFISLTSHGKFTKENAPYIIQKCVEGLLTPNDEKDKTVMFYDLDGTEKTVSKSDAYKYALELFHNYDLDKAPDKYYNIYDCLDEYIHIIQNEYESEPEDWYERNEHGDFDEV
jgi:hypothetical protein